MSDIASIINEPSENRKKMNRLEKQKFEKMVEYIEAKEAASNSTLKLPPVNIEGDKAYFINLGDVHVPECDMLALVETLKELAKIPNVIIGLGGDAINNSIKTSIGDTHAEVATPEEQVKILAMLIEEAGIKDKIAYILSGNHEYRSEKVAGINPTTLLAAELGLQDRLVKNTARLTINLKDPKTGEVTSSNAIINHGVGAPSKAAAQGDYALLTKIDKSADIYVYEHNHQAAFASTKKFVKPHGKKKEVEKQIVYMNFGSTEHGSEYAHRANYPAPKIADADMMRITSINGQNVKDKVNLRSLIDETEKEILEAIQAEYTATAARKYKTGGAVKKAFISTTKNVLKTHIKDYKDQKAEELLKPKKGSPEKVFLAVLAGGQVGSEEVDNMKQLKHDINVIKQLNGSAKLILNGDMINYKKAITIAQGKQGEKFVGHTYANIKTLAKELKKIDDIKNKLVGISFGHEEMQIMKYQGEELAEMAMVDNQMDEDLVYVKQTKQQILNKQIEIQEQYVKQHNKKVLNEATDHFYSDLETSFEEKLYELLEHSIDDFKKLPEEEQEQLFTETYDKYKAIEADKEIKAASNSKNKKGQEKSKKLRTKTEKQRAFIKDILYRKVRKDGDFLDIKDTETINEMFPLEDIDVKEVHPNLLAHMLCDFLEMTKEEIKKLNISKNNEEVVMTDLKLKDKKHRVHNIQVVHSSSKSKAKTRGTIQNHLGGMMSVYDEGDVYLTSPKLGKEFMVATEAMLTDENNDNYYKDRYLIGTGSEASKTSVNRLYKLYAVGRDEELKEARGIYQNAYKPFDLYAESLDFRTALLENDVLEEVALHMGRKMCKTAIVKTEFKKLEEKVDDLMDGFDKEFVVEPEEDLDQLENWK